MSDREQVVRSVESTAGAVVGMTGDVFATPGVVFSAELHVDQDAEVPGGVAVLTPGYTSAALVKIAPTGGAVTARSVCIKLPEAYGPGADQDFLLASSLDGIPWHHAIVHRSDVAGVYSTLWLYLAGWTPTVFGVRAAQPSTPHGGYTAGDRLEFLLSGAVSRFHRIGALELGEQIEVDQTRFAAAHCGGGLRALPPVSRYTST